MSSVLSPVSVARIAKAELPISYDSVELIIKEENSGEQTYINRYQHPEWPGGKSGVTIMLGYDCGYANPAKIRKDLGGKIPEPMIQALIGVCGITGQAARTATARIKNLVKIPWDVALDVFLDNDMPEWIDTVFRKLPKAKALPADCLGALVSLAYNRGASFDQAGDRYREMRAIRDHLIVGDLDLIPKEFRSMRRLWGSDQQGLRDRREREAQLFERGLGRTGGFDGPATAVIQSRLNELGQNPTLSVDNSFGPKTAQAVKDFQGRNGLPQTGAVNAATWAAMNSATQVAHGN